MGRVTTTDAFYDVALLYYTNEIDAKTLEVPVEYQHSDGSTFHPIGLVIGLGVSLLAFRVRHSL